MLPTSQKKPPKRSPFSKDVLSFASLLLKLLQEVFLPMATL